MGIKQFFKKMSVKLIERWDKFWQEIEKYEKQSNEDIWLS